MTESQRFEREKDKGTKILVDCFDLANGIDLQ